MAYTDKHLERAETELKRDLKEATETLSHKHEMLSAEFENFKQRDFRELEGRVTALEKKFAKLQEAFANFKIPEMGGATDEAALRELANKCADLQN